MGEGKSMKLQESGEMYLETLLVLLQQKPHVRAVDVGDYMGYSKPSGDVNRVSPPRWDCSKRADWFRPMMQDI